MQMSYLYASDLSFKNFIYSRHLTSFGSYCKEQIDIRFDAPLLLLKINFVISLSKFVAERSTATLTMLWRNLSSIRGLTLKKQTLIIICKVPTWQQPWNVTSFPGKTLRTRLLRRRKGWLPRIDITKQLVSRNVTTVHKSWWKFCSF